jgi:hypothetical protein
MKMPLTKVSQFNNVKTKLGFYGTRQKERQDRQKGKLFCKEWGEFQRMEVKADIL